MMVEAVGIRFPCHYAAAGRSLPGSGAGVAGARAGDVRHGSCLRLRGGMNLRLTSAGETYISSRYAGMVELVDAADSKSAARKSLWVQVPLPVPEKAGGHGESWPLFYLNRASGRVCRQKASAFCLMEWLWVKAADGRCLHLPFFARAESDYFPFCASSSDWSRNPTRGTVLRMGLPCASSLLLSIWM